MKLIKKLSVVFILTGAFTAAGCAKGDETTEKAKPIVGLPGQVVEGGGAVQQVRRAPQRIVDMTELNNLSLGYYQFKVEHGRPPKSLDDLKDSVTPKLVQAINEGLCVVVWDVRDNSPGTIVAYVKEPDNAGMRVVATADGRVGRLSEAEFQAGLKGQ